MAQQIVAGNWKMNKSATEAVELAGGIIQNLQNDPVSDVLTIMAPPFLYLQRIAGIVADARQDGLAIEAASQNCCWERSGAYTGEVSANMIASIRSNYVIIGHSERRSYFKETNSILARKVDLALDNGLRAIYCCGETIVERKGGGHFKTVLKQIKEGLCHLPPDRFSQVVIAYEPVWAIGTGETATPEQAQEMHEFIRNLVKEEYGQSVANDVSILYGGSCKPSNAMELFANPDIDGGLIGGASLNATDFTAIIRSFK